MDDIDSSFTNTTSSSEDYNGDDKEILNASMKLLLQKHKEEDCVNFLKKVVLDRAAIKRIERETRADCHKNTLWHELRFGRVTASIAYKVSQSDDDCYDGQDEDLISQIMGSKIPDTCPMSRARGMIEKVRAAVSEKLDKNFRKCGLLISKKYPMLAGTLNGICKDSIIKIKCPTSKRTYNRLIRNGGISEELNAQIQMQMYLSERKKCYICVAHWEFDRHWHHDDDVKIFSVMYDETYIVDLLEKLTTYWETSVYPVLYYTIHATSMKIELPSIKIEPSSIKIEPSSIKIEPSSIKIEPSSIKIEPSSIEIEPSFIKIEPSSIKIEPSSIKIEKSSDSSEGHSSDDESSSSEGDSCDNDKIMKVSMKLLLLKYKEKSCNKFLKKIFLPDAVIKKVERGTRSDHRNSVWHELRYGRITASLAYKVSRSNCYGREQMEDLLSEIMGGEIPDNAAMCRARDMMGEVREAVSDTLNKNFKKCGLLISKKYPILAATLNGISKDSIIKIKCPKSKRSYNYLIESEGMSAELNAQVQMQMYLSGRRICYVCVAHWKFDQHRHHYDDVEIFHVKYDETYVSNLLEKLIIYWKTYVYPVLYQTLVEI